MSEEDFHCAICFLVFFDPVTITSCSHTFCRRCLNDSNQKIPGCPMCRGPIPASFSIKDAREDFKMTNRVKSAFPKEYQERVDEETAKLIGEVYLENSTSQKSEQKEKEKPSPPEPTVRKPTLHCPLCFKVFFDPITIPTCAHSYCRQCIVEASATFAGCPLCRSAFPPGFSPKSAREDFSVSQKVKLTYPRELQEREDEETAKLLERFSIEDQRPIIPQVPARLPDPPAPPPLRVPYAVPVPVPVPVPCFPPAPRPVSLIHPHPLQYSVRSFICDVCHANYRGFGRPSYNCPQCDFDLCEGCAQVNQFIQDKKFHHHPLVRTMRNSFYCNICRTKWNRSTSYYCSDCDFDVCQTCYGAPANRPGHPHALTKILRDYRCDVCSREFHNNAHYCALCEYDECLDCFNAGNSRSAPNCGYCLKQLTINMQPYGNGFFKCNVCRQSQNGPAYQCKPHNWDVCLRCAGNKSTRLDC